MSERICILLRHGDYHQLVDTPSAHQPFGLTDRGKEQARLAVERILRMIDRHRWTLDSGLHCSCLLRAWETAQIVLDGLPCCHRIHQTDRLTERCVGNGANLSRTQIEDALAQDPRLAPIPRDWKSNSHYRLPFVGAESLMESGERVACYLREAMCDVAPNHAVLFVGHGASMRHAAHLLGVLPFERLAELSMHHAEPVALSLSVDGVWQHVAGQWKDRLIESKQMD